MNNNSKVLVKNTNTIRHSDGRINKLYIAKITNIEVVNQNGSFRIEDKYVAFELPNDYVIDQNIENLIIKSYISNNKNTNECLYLGELFQDYNHNLCFYSKSNKIQNYVDEVISNKIKEQNKQMNKVTTSLSDNTIKQVIDANNNQEQYQQRIINRKNNPTLKEIHCEIDDNNRVISTDYIGVNVNTGDYLGLNNVKKIGKDQNNTYLYYAEINNKHNLDDAEVLSREMLRGTPVCFETKLKINDIIKSNNQENIKKILELLSTNYYLNDNSIYIGKMDENGIIIRNKESTSEPINTAIDAITKEVKNIQNNQKQTYR